jgi:hypothetical protein
VDCWHVWGLLAWTQNKIPIYCQPMLKLSTQYDFHELFLN